MNNQDHFNNTIELSKYFIERFYARDLDSILPLLHPEVIWIGAADRQYYQGYPEVANQLALVYNAPIYRLNILDFCVADRDTSSCTVTGQFSGETEQESGQILSAVQRATFVWKLTNGGPQIIHMHVSTPLISQIRNEDLHQRAGSRTYESIQRLLLRQSARAHPISFCGKNRETLFIRPEDIFYVEAININCMIHCPSTTPVVCQPMARVVSALPPYFVRIHRSYIVNPYHVSEIRRCYVMLKNGEQLPIPEKKYREVRNCLKNYSDAI